VLLVHVPGARLGVRVLLGVGVVDLVDLGEVLVLQPVALVVLVAEPAEQLREREPTPFASWSYHAAVPR
jgi:hypothetical protein